jgi:hypothetical protein
MNHVQIMNTSSQGNLIFRRVWLYSQPYCSCGHHERPLVLLSRIYLTAEAPFPGYLHQSLCESWDSVLKDSTTASLQSLPTHHSWSPHLIQWYVISSYGTAPLNNLRINQSLMSRDLNIL